MRIFRALPNHFPMWMALCLALAGLAGSPFPAYGQDAGPVLIKEVASREASIHVGGVQVPVIRQRVSREASLFVENGPAEPYAQVISRQVSLVVGDAAEPPAIGDMDLDVSPTGTTVTLDWSSYNQWAVGDIARFDIYLSDSGPITDISGLTPVASVARETSSITLDGLAAFTDHFFVVVPVDVLGGSDPAFSYSAAYVLSPQTISREVTLHIGGETTPPYRYANSRETSLVLASPEPPPPITDLTITASPTGDSATLDWSSYNQWAEADIDHYAIYFSDDAAFTDVSGMTPYRIVPGETLTVTLEGLTPFTDHYFAVVPVDGLGQFDPIASYSAAYVLSPQTISRELALYVGDEPEPPYAQAISREVWMLRPDAAVPAPVTGVDSGFSVQTSTAAFGAVDMDWTSYDEISQRDVAWYRIYVGPAFFEDVSGLTPFASVPVGTQLHTLSGLPGGDILYFAVVAEDALDNFDPVVRAFSAKVSITGVGEVANLAVDSAADSLTYHWNPPAEGGGFLSSYQLYFDGAATPLSLPASTTSWQATGLTAASGYSLRVATLDIFGNESAGTSLFAATLLPNPDNLLLTGVGANAVLSWDAVEPAGLVQHYAIYRSATPLTDVSGLTPMAISTATSHTVGPIASALGQYFAVVSVNISGAGNPLVNALFAEKLSQTIDFPALSTGAAIIPLAATASSGLPLRFTAVPAEVATVDAANLLVAQGGSVLVTALQDGDASFSPAAASQTLRLPPLIHSVTVDGVELADGKVFSQAAETLEVDARDADGIALAELYGRLPGGAWQLLDSDDVASNGLVLTVPVEALPDGAYELRVVVTAPGNYSSERSHDVIVASLATVFVDDLAGFEAAVAGGTLIGIEDFEQADFSAGDFGLTADPLSQGVANPPVFATGLLQPLTVQSNTLGGNSATVSPAGVDALVAVPAGWNGAVSSKLVSHVAGSSTDLLFAAEDRISAVGFNPVTLDGPGVFTVSVYDTDNILRNRFLSNADIIASRHVGILMPDGHFIGRINLHSADDEFEGGDNIALYTSTSGPEFGTVSFNGTVLGGGDTVTQPGTLTIIATDPSGVGRVEARLDGQLFATATSSTDSFSIPWDVSAFSDGPHTLSLRAYDTLDNATTVDYALTIALQAPPVPTLILPLDGLVSNRANIQINGAGEAGAEALIFVNGVQQPTPLAIDAQGAFYGTITLVEGLNQLQAVARNRGGDSPRSAEVNVSLDSNIPAAPVDLVAAGLPAGVIRLDWSPPGGSGISGYHVYRSDAPFLELAQAVRVNSTLLTASAFDDLPPVDGRYYYRVVSVNQAGTQSPVSLQVEASADNTPPRAVAIRYLPQGAHDPVSGVVGVGTLDLELEVDEALQTVPFLSLAPASGGPIGVPLQETGPQVYSGSVVIDAATASGTALAVFSARDQVGNRGSEVLAGASLVIDTDGPLATAFTVQPADPIENDAQPTSVQVSFGLSEPPKAGTAPTMSWRLSGAGRVAQPLTLVDDGVGGWSGSFTLPADAGDAQPETLSFALNVVDALDNPGAQTLPTRQVYQGELPPPAVPQALTAVVRPGGVVALAWSPVADAVDYQLYRGSGDAGPLDPLARSAGAPSYEDTPAADGRYRYAVASVRSANASESLSAHSNEVLVDSDSVPPAAPTDLQLELLPIGIQAVWQAPGGTDPLRFNLYRDSGPTLTSVAGLTPVAANIPDLFTVDPTPSPLLPVYAVTALDQAGNESPPSGWAFLNIDLYPVNTLQVLRRNQDYPLLSWGHDGLGIAGYNVYLGEPPDWIKLTPSAIAGNDYQDTGFTGDQRLYSVVAVDSSGTESLPRSILLPDVEITRTAGEPVLRGLMNRLEYEVVNHGSDGIQGAVLHAELDGRGHQSEPFDVAAGETRSVPLVVGGYRDLPAVAGLVTTLAIAPNPGEQVEIVNDASIAVEDGALGLQLRARDLTRGGSGQVRFVLDNSSAVEVALVTALANGSADSPDLRLSLLDGDGNLLSSVALRQALGAGVTTLADGRSVVRIPAGGSFESDWFELPVPTVAPDNATIELQVAQLHYHPGEPDAVAIDGSTARLAVTLTETPYTGSLLEITPLFTFGDEPVVIRGQALNRADGQPRAFAPLKLVVATSGYERYFEVVTDPTGEFSFPYSALPQESGVYRVSVVHPDVSDRPEQGEFTIGRLFADPSHYQLHVPRNYDAELRFTLRAAAAPGNTATNARLVYLDEDQPLDVRVPGVTISPAPPVNLTEGESASVSVGLRASDAAPDGGTLFLRLVSDEGGDVSRQRVQVDFAFSDAEPALFHSPGLVEMGGVPGEQSSAQVNLENQGLAPMLGVTLSLHASDGGAAPDWFQLGSAAAIGTLDIGQIRPVELIMTPGTAVQEGLYELLLRVSADNHASVDIPVFVSVTLSGQGNVLFHIEDIYTATLDENGVPIAGLAGALIELQNERVATVFETLTTDAGGEALFNALPAGRYRFRVSAPDHKELGGVLQVSPGVTTTEDAFLDFDLVSVQWSVTEVALLDHYDVRLDATFHTDVPAAVVVMQPASINLPEMAVGEIFYGELTITNHGLIRADRALLTPPPSNAFYRIELLADVPDTLEAKQRLVIPYRVIKLADDGGAAGSAGGGCKRTSWPSIACGTYTYEYTCANDDVRTGTGVTCWVLSEGSVSGCDSSGGGVSLNVSGSAGGGGSTPKLDPSSIDFDCEDCKGPTPNCKVCYKPKCVLGSKRCKVDPDQNGRRCGTEPGQECLVCKDGACTQPPDRCTPEKEPKESLDLIPGPIQAVINLIGTTISAAPFLKISLILGAETSRQTGKECCSDCNRPAPVPFTELSASITVGGKLQATTPSRPSIEFGFLSYYRVAGAIGLGVQGTIDVTGTGKQTEKQSECSDCDGSLTATVGASGKAAVVGSATLGLQKVKDLSCLIKTKPGTDKRDACYETVYGVLAEAEGAISTGVKGTGGHGLPDTPACGTEICTVEIGKVEVTATVKVEISIPLLPKYTVSHGITPIVLSDGETYDCAQ